MLDQDSSLDKTFSIEEEESFLNKFGTPIQFKKLMEKPATVPPKFNKNIENDFMKVENSPINIKQAVRLKLNKSILKEQNRLNDTDFFSPSSFEVKKSFIKNFDSLKLSPVHYGNTKYKSKTNKTQFYVQSTPNCKENINTNRVNRESFRASPRLEICPTSTKRQVTFDTSPSTNFVWSLKKKRDDAEKLKKEQLDLEQSRMETCEARSIRMEQVSKNFQEKLRQFVLENQKSAAAEKSSEIITPVLTAQPVEPVNHSPDIHAAYLARRERDAEFHKRRQEAIVASDTPAGPIVQSNAAKKLEEKLRKWNEANALELNESKPVAKTPLSSNLASSSNKKNFGSASRVRTSNMPRSTNDGFATPMSVTRSQKKAGNERATVTRWR